MEKRNGFYIIVSGSRGPSSFPHRHPNYQSAIAEAERLAGKHPSDEFFILQTIQSVRANRFVKADAIPDDSQYIHNDYIPF